MPPLVRGEESSDRTSRLLGKPIRIHESGTDTFTIGAPPTKLVRMTNQSIAASTFSASSPQKIEPKSISLSYFPQAVANSICLHQSGANNATTSKAVEGPLLSTVTQRSNQANPCHHFTVNNKINSALQAVSPNTVPLNLTLTNVTCTADTEILKSSKSKRSSKIKAFTVTRKLMPKGPTAPSPLPPPEVVKEDTPAKPVEEMSRSTTPPPERRSPLSIHAPCRFYRCTSLSTQKHTLGMLRRCFRCLGNYSVTCGNIANGSCKIKLNQVECPLCWNQNACYCGAKFSDRFLGSQL